MFQQRQDSDSLSFKFVSMQLLEILGKIDIFKVSVVIETDMYNFGIFKSTVFNTN